MEGGLYLLVFSVDISDRLDHIREFSAVLVESPHVPHVSLDVPHHLLQLLEALQALLYPIQLCLHSITKLGLDRRLREVIACDI